MERGVAGGGADGTPGGKELIKMNICTKITLKELTADGNGSEGDKTADDDDSEGP